MGLETPVGAGIEASGGEGALDAELVLLGLHVVGDGLQGVEVVDVVDALDLGTIGGDVLVEDVLVVDQAVGFHNVRHADDLVAVLQRHILVDELVVRLGILHIGGVALPVLVANRAVDLEQGRGFGLCDLGLQRLLVGAGGCGLNLDLDAGLLGVFLGQSSPLIG